MEGIRVEMRDWDEVRHVAGPIRYAIFIETSKTGRSRKIPIHQDLKDQGFLDFVAGQRGRPLFFPKAKLLEGKNLTIHRTRAEGLAEWVQSLEGLEELSVAPNHGWRHRFRTECRRLYMDREVRNYLQGHSVESTGEDGGKTKVKTRWKKEKMIIDIDFPTRPNPAGGTLTPSLTMTYSLDKSGRLLLASTVGIGATVPPLTVERVYDREQPPG